MAAGPPEGMPSIIPYLHYDDVAGALEWLAKSFGLAVHLSMPGSDGSILHAEMSFGNGMILLGPSNAEHGLRSPRSLDGVNQTLYVYVDDVDAHCRRARAAGAQILKEPVDMFWGDRMYTARDCEGHHWTFAQHVRDVAPGDMKPPSS
jgi:uncharacterized glyoxalase superfamily protein PhnB